MEIRAKLSYARISPRKMRLVTNLCKGLPITEARNQLTFSSKKGAKFLIKLLDSALANAKNKGGIDTESLYVKNAYVDCGPTMKRYLPRSMGRATPILKRMSHVTIILDEAR